MSDEAMTAWTERYKPWTATPFERWVVDEGLEVVQLPRINDISTMELAPWERTGTQAMILDLTSDPAVLAEAAAPSKARRLVGQGMIRYVCEIPPGGTYKAERHMYDELFVVVKGRGATSVWYEGHTKQTFEWQEDSVFSIPLNAWHEIYNASGEEPARLLATTTAPTAMNYYASPEFVFNCPMAFLDRFDPDDELYFSGKTTKLEHRFTETNFIPNALAAAMDTWEARGPGTNMMISMANANLVCHMSEFPPMSYKKGHSSRAIRPGRGGNTTAYLMLSGVGYDLQWPNGVKPAPGVPLGERIDYQRHTILTNGAGYHQHFNISEEPIRYLVLRFGNPRFSGGGSGTRNEDAVNSNIEFENEDPAIREMFQQELGKRGLESAMRY